MTGHEEGATEQLQPCPKCGHQRDTPNHHYGCPLGLTQTECHDLDGTRVQGDPDMSDDARDALRTVITATRARMAVEELAVHGWWKQAQAPCDAVVARLRKQGVTDPDLVLLALRPVVEWVNGEALR